MTSLSARSVSVDRGGRAIVKNIHFELRAGEALVALGRNGAGKSTLLRAIAGFLPLSGGELTHAGEASEAPLPELCHYVGHADGLKSALTASENLEFWARMLATPSSGESLAPSQALHRMGLKRLADFPVAYLSAGQKRRVALARLFVSPRPLWILDEPATALDVASQEILGEAFARHRASGGMIIAATHAPLGLIDAAVLDLSATDAGAIGNA
ncbi:heme ABC exporter ATP-binding protein CcmA [Rhodoblastus sphagnicola]|uniref:Heme ABC exporter ATP-binding protein CcmA n=1 Tax=Rhodoblastus sphagnicola TaxID=333368 RepID=A0A2S6MZ72_9HYPH|nr:heme ABC exporter ATP-binding protein CcmA [Rhodoblastus sphagnicola]MBB4198614.1 heme exporter protein A [Rhodoblastus sphagnicola]PPQ27667.1 heme ABC exporter ATP-binding protein CcmA [Rhodoblastus sphagnicola]